MKTLALSVLVGGLLAWAAATFARVYPTSAPAGSPGREACAIPREPSSNPNQSCLDPSQFPEARAALPWLQNPDSIVWSAGHLRLVGMLVESQHGRPYDVQFAYGSTGVYRAPDTNIPASRKFADVTEVGDTIFPQGLTLISEPNGAWFGQAGSARPPLSLAVWSNLGTRVVSAIAHALWRRLVGRPAYTDPVPDGRENRSR
jgi:hypothetical protein